MAKIETTLPSGQAASVGSLFKEEYPYVGSQLFTTVHNYSQVYSIEVNGVGALSESQYVLIPPKTILINDPLELDDFLVIIYGQGNVGTLPYYTQAQTDILLEEQEEFSEDLFITGAKIYAGTGVTSKEDNFELVMLDTITVTIKAVDAILFYEQLFVPNIEINEIVRTFPEINYPLTELVTATGSNVNIDPIVADGIYLRYIGYDLDGNVYSSATNFLENSDIAQLGFLLVINSGGVVTFLSTTPGGRNVFSAPILASTDALQRTITSIATTITINYNTGSPTLKANPGIITGLSINWRGFNNPGNTAPINKFSYVGDDFVDFVSLTPLSLTETSPFTIHTLWTELEDGFQINESFFNTTSQLRDELDLGSYGVKRVLIGVRGGFFIQEPEFATSVGYATLDEARANVFVHPFSDAIIPADSVLEIARIIYLKSVTDFSDDNAFIIVTTNNGGGTGGTVAPVSDATTVSKGIVKLANDLGGTADLPTTPTAIHITGDESKSGSLSVNSLSNIALQGSSTTNVGVLANTFSLLQPGLMVKNSSATGDIAYFLDNTDAVVSKVAQNGNITSTAFIKSGGLSTQFLKADGSIDSNTYLTSSNGITGVGSVGIIPKFTAARVIANSDITNPSPGLVFAPYAGRVPLIGNVVLSAQRSQCQFDVELGNPPTQDVGLITDNSLGLRLGSTGYIMFSTGGQTAASEKARISATTGDFLVNTTFDPAYGVNPSSGGKITIGNTSGNNGLSIRNGGSGAYQANLNLTSNDTVGLRLTYFDGGDRTILQYAGTIGAILGASNGKVIVTDAVQFNSNGLERARFAATTNGGFLVNTTSDNGADKIQVNGSILATTIRKSGGLSTEFLKADGSVDTTVYAKAETGFKTLNQAAYTFISGDEYSTIYNVYTAGDSTYTIPNDSTFNFPVGTKINISYVGGTGTKIHFAAAGGVTFVSPNGRDVQYTGTFILTKTAANTWHMDGSSGFFSASSGQIQSFTTLSMGYIYANSWLVATKVGVDVDLGIQFTSSDVRFNYLNGINNFTFNAGFNGFFSNLTWAPTSGANSFTSFTAAHVINQTGTATGITRGLLINPTLTSAVDYRGVDIENKGTAIGLRINNAAAATGKPFRYLKNLVEKAYVDDPGNLMAQSFIKAGGTATQYLMADGSTTFGNTKTRKDITGTSYTLLSSDADKILYTTNASPVTITVPSGLTINQEYEVFQYAAGQVTFVTSGTTLRFLDYELASTYGIYARVNITYIDTETYQLIGQLSMI